MNLPAGRPELLGVGATAGVTAGFLALFAMAHMGWRGGWNRGKERTISRLPRQVRQEPLLQGGRINRWT